MPNEYGKIPRPLLWKWKLSSSNVNNDEKVEENDAQSDADTDSSFLGDCDEEGECEIDWDAMPGFEDDDLADIERAVLRRRRRAGLMPAMNCEQPDGGEDANTTNLHKRAGSRICRQRTSECGDA